jgi:hypothetical protein
MVSLAKITTKGKTSHEKKKTATRKLKGDSRPTGQRANLAAK